MKLFTLYTAGVDAVANVTWYKYNVGVIKAAIEGCNTRSSICIQP